MIQSLEVIEKKANKNFNEIMNNKKDCGTKKKEFFKNK